MLVVPEPDVVEAEPEVVDEVEVVEAPRLRDRLGKTRAAFVRSLAAVRGRGAIDDETWDELEETLLLADVGLPTTDAPARQPARAGAEPSGSPKPTRSIDALHEELVALLDESGDRTLVTTAGEPNVWMFVGVNGVGQDHDHRQGRAARDRRRPQASCSPPPTRSAPPPPSS